MKNPLCLVYCSIVVSLIAAACPAAEESTIGPDYADTPETRSQPGVPAGKIVEFTMDSKDYKINFTKNPKGRATMGGSSGGAAAFTMAWFHPELYQKVLTYSGTYVNQQFPVDPKTPHGAWEYHENLIKRSVKKPIRIWLEVSEKDNGWDRDEASLHNWVMANQRMAAELKAKGYDYRYIFAKNAGHTDGKVTRQTLPGALEWLWQDYPVK